MTRLVFFFGFQKLINQKTKTQRPNNQFILLN